MTERQTADASSIVVYNLVTGRVMSPEDKIQKSKGQVIAAESLFFDYRKRLYERSRELGLPVEVETAYPTSILSPEQYVVIQELARVDGIISALRWDEGGSDNRVNSILENILDQGTVAAAADDCVKFRSRHINPDLRNPGILPVNSVKE